MSRIGMTSRTYRWTAEGPRSCWWQTGLPSPNLVADDAQSPCAAASRHMGRARGLEELNGEHDSARRRHRRAGSRTRD